MQRLFLSMGAVTTLLAAFHFLTSGSCGAEKDKPAASEGKTLDQQLAAYQKLSRGLRGDRAHKCQREALGCRRGGAYRRRSNPRRLAP